MIRDRALALMLQAGVVRARGGGSSLHRSQQGHWVRTPPKLDHRKQGMFEEPPKDNLEVYHLVGNYEYVPPREEYHGGSMLADRRRRYRMGRPPINEPEVHCPVEDCADIPPQAPRGYHDG